MHRLLAAAVTVKLVCACTVSADTAAAGFKRDSKLDRTITDGVAVSTVELSLAASCYSRRIEPVHDVVINKVPPCNLLIHALNISTVVHLLLHQTGSLIHSVH
jgi:hypothetical protein